LPETECAAYNVLALPVYNDMTEAEARAIGRAIRTIHEYSDQIRQSRSN
jgi:dTDP-4-amino-4,6-dideoxygalactose transaminase